MKKTLLTVLVTLTMVCLFAFGASAYECDDFSIDVPDDYTITENDNGVVIQKDGVVITIYCGDAMGDTFVNITEAKKTAYDNIVKGSYESYGTIVDYESNFVDDGSAGAMTFSFELTGGTIEGDVEGLMYIENDYLYHAVLILTDDELYDEAEDIMETFRPNTARFSQSDSEPEPALTTSAPAMVPTSDPETTVAADKTTAETVTVENTENEDKTDKEDKKDDDDNNGGLNINVVIIAVAAVAVAAIIAVAVIKKKN